jgi:hypothetical protein
MAKSSRKRVRLRKNLPEPETAQADILKPRGGRVGNRLAAAFQKLREGQGREATDLCHDIVKPSETPLVAHINRGVRHDEHGRHATRLRSRPPSAD